MLPVPCRTLFALPFVSAIVLPLWSAQAAEPSGPPAPPPPPPLTAAVFNFQTTGDSLAGKGSEAAALLDARLSDAAPEVNLVERQELDKLLGEQELGLSGTVTPETAAKVGALTGAKVLITGRLFEAGDQFYLVVKIIGTETSRVYGESVAFTTLAALDKAVDALAPKIASDLRTRADTLVAKVEDPAAQLDRLRKVVAGKTGLPSVSVDITEQHLSHWVIDPAAQTEMKLMLQQLGFEVIDAAASGKQADVKITGEAFSEFAGRHGNLVSCRSRVEIKAVRSADGKLVLVDRQVDTAVDPAENIAGKGALENASRRLLDRLTPKLVE